MKVTIVINQEQGFDNEPPTTEDTVITITSGDITIVRRLFDTMTPERLKSELDALAQELTTFQ